jgi:hypothetical protein
MAEEWAQTGDDVLWRRTKLGLASPTERRGRSIASWQPRAPVGRRRNKRYDDSAPGGKRVNKHILAIDQRPGTRNR